MTATRGQLGVDESRRHRPERLRVTRRLREPSRLEHDEHVGPPPAQRAGRLPGVLAATSALLGALLVIDVVLPHHWHMHQFLPLPARATAQALTVLAGWLLLRISRGLRKRRRTEWRLATALTAGVLVADVARGGHRPVESAVCGLLLLGLICARRRFTVVAGPVGRWRVLALGLWSLVLATVFGLVLLYLPGRVPHRIPFTSRLGEVLASLVGCGGWIPVHGDEYREMLHALLLGAGLLTLLVVAVAWLRPASAQCGLAADDEQRLRGLLARHGARDSLGYFALRRDKSVVWSPTGKAAITYRVVDGVALAGADPLGDPEAWPGAIAAFRTLVDTHGWTPAVMGCSELGATVYAREYGLSTIALGDEAIVDVDRFTLDGRSMRGVRQAYNRVARAGYEIDVRRVRELSDDEVAELATAAESWRTDPVERGFSMALSRLGDDQDPRCVVVRAYRDGTLAGLLHFVPWSDDGLSLDLMRRDRTADNGLNEFMIVTLVQCCAELGVNRVSLNFAVFRDAIERGERIGAGPVLRLWRRVLLIASRWWQIESLYRFNDKFAPTWEPRFFSYSRVRDLPRIAIAALEAEAFLVRPARPRRRVRSGG